MQKAEFMQTTVGHYGLRWFDNALTAHKCAKDDLGSVVPMYVGSWDKIPIKLATRLATIHPSFSKYYEDAMMPLWALHGTYNKYGSIKDGTEDPRLALAWKTRDTHPFVVIWRIFETEEGDNG